MDYPQGFAPHSAGQFAAAHGAKGRAQAMVDFVKAASGASWPRPALLLAAFWLVGCTQTLLSPSQFAAADAADGQATTVDTTVGADAAVDQIAGPELGAGDTADLPPAEDAAVEVALEVAALDSESIEIASETVSDAAKPECKEAVDCGPPPSPCLTLACVGGACVPKFAATGSPCEDGD